MLQSEPKTDNKLSLTGDLDLLNSRLSKICQRLEGAANQLHGPILTEVKIDDVPKAVAVSFRGHLNNANEIVGKIEGVLNQIEDRL